MYVDYAVPSDVTGCDAYVSVAYSYTVAAYESMGCLDGWYESGVTDDGA